jgi:hypothetical protein
MFKNIETATSATMLLLVLAALGLMAMRKDEEVVKS